MEIPVTIDMIQEFRGLCNVPEIRVWCHPEKVGKVGEDYWAVCESFEEAMSFIKSTPEAEPVPLIAYNGYEINIFDIVPFV